MSSEYLRNICREREGRINSYYSLCLFWKMGEKMRITYDSKYDVLYLQFKDTKEVICKTLTDDITIDVDEKDKMAGIEILSASKHIDLDKLLPIESKEKVAV